MRKLWKKVDSIYDEPINKVLEEMRTYSPETDEFAASMRHLETLSTLKAANTPKRANADMMLLVAGNLLGILIIVAYEQKHVITTKATGFIIKPK